MCVNKWYKAYLEILNFHTYKYQQCLASYVLSSRIGLHRIELIYKTLVNDEFSKTILNFLFIYVKSQILLKTLAFKVIRIRIYSR